MKKELNFLELHFLVDELQVCVGARANRIYEPDGVLFQFHKSGVGKYFLRIMPNVLWLADSKPKAPDNLSRLCGSLRKYLEGKKLTKIEQLGSERIVQLTFETLKEKFFLFVELFSNGNIVLTDDNKKIIIAKDEREWKDRTIKRGVQYVFPPSKDDLFSLKSIPGDESKIARLGFGKLLAREIVARGGDFKAYRSLVTEKSNPVLYSDGELSPIVLKQYDEVGTRFSSFSELINSRIVQPVSAPVDKAFLAKRKKILEVLSLQMKSVSSLEGKAAELQVKGDFIYEHYQELQDVLNEFEKAKAKLSLQDMKKKLTGHPKIKDFNPKTGDIVIEL